MRTDDGLGGCILARYNPATYIGVPGTTETRAEGTLRSVPSWRGMLGVLTGSIFLNGFSGLQEYRRSMFRLGSDHEGPRKQSRVDRHGPRLVESGGTRGPKRIRGS